MLKTFKLPAVQWPVPESRFVDQLSYTKPWPVRVSTISMWQSPLQFVYPVSPSMNDSADDGTGTITAADVPFTYFSVVSLSSSSPE